MKKFDWQLTIQSNITRMKVVGLWPEGEAYKLNLYALWAVTCLSLFIYAHYMSQTIYIIFIFTDLEAVVACLFVEIPQMLTMIKTCYVVQNMKLLKRLMVTLNSDIFQPKNSRQIKLVEPSLKFWQATSTVFWSMAAVSLFFFVSFPILDKAVLEHRLPFLAWYPYNEKKSPFYEITYIYQIFCAIWNAIAACSVDTLIAALNMYTGAQFDILCDSLRHVFEITSSSPSVSNRLTNCVIHHREILNFAKNSNKFFNWIVFLQFFISAISIGITMFQLTLVVPLSNEFFTLLIFGLAMTMEIFIFCWFGNEVELKSCKIPFAAFESNWMDASVEMKKKIIFFIMKSQTPCKISALNLFYLSLDTFMKILRAAWSYFALLNQVNVSK